jgi:protein-S-isoprenylcysteine O-methyltransferase Ste14
MAFIDLKIPPPALGVFIAAGMWGIARNGAFSFTTFFELNIGIKYFLTIALFFLGLALELAGVLAFRQSKTTVNPLKPERTAAVVNHGIYRFTRNPMYLGMVCMLLALAVYLGLWLCFAGPVAFVIYITNFQIKPEERVLERLFGAPYIDYCKRIRRWL